MVNWNDMLTYCEVLRDTNWDRLEWFSYTQGIQYELRNAPSLKDNMTLEAEYQARQHRFEAVVLGLLGSSAQWRPEWFQFHCAYFGVE